MSDESEAELFEVREERVCRRPMRREHSCANTTRARKHVICAKDGGGRCGLVEGSVEGERDEVVRVSDTREDNVRDTRVDEFEACEVLNR